MATLDLSSEGVTLELAGKRHARELARSMRVKDMNEIRASGGFIPEPAVRASINRSTEAWAVRKGGDLLCVFGVTRMPQNPDLQVVWMMSSVHVDKHPITFWRCSKIVVEYLRGKYPYMVNMVHGQYTEALRWLERLGFKLSPPEPFGVRGDLFVPISLQTKSLIEVAYG